MIKPGQSLLDSSQHFPNNHPYTDYEACLATPRSALETTHDYLLFASDANQQAATQIPYERHCMNDQYYYTQPQLALQAYPTVLPPNGEARHDSASFGADFNGNNWSMLQPSMNLSANPTHRPLKRARTHQRTPSASTIASNGPASPYTANTLYPQIANTDYSPNSPGQAAYAEQAFFQKNLPTPSQTPTDANFYTAYNPSQVAHTPNAHLAMKGVALDYNLGEDFAQDFYQSSRPSMSSHGRNSPATPQSAAPDNYDAKQYAQQNDYRQTNPNVQLFRTESQAYQDELYNPAATYTSTPAAPKPQPNLLTPHRNLVSERLQTANLARSTSPASAISRERSPFRDGSVFAQAGWDNAQTMNTAAGMRQQMKEQSDQAELAQHRPQLQREPTKTISPKDAMLEYTGADEPSLFQDSIPAGYKQHNGTTESWQNGFVSQPGSSFGNLVANGTNAQMQPFRQASADNTNETTNYGFVPLPPTSQPEQATQLQSTPAAYNNFAVPKMNYGDSNPEFPAHLTSMESSISEGGPPASSQESFNMTSAPQRPTDTRAHTGSYTCTYHGCTQRFESHNSLQKHKRDAHRPQQKEPTPEEQDGSAHSPRDSESPVPSGMTSAAIQARNSQAGPHKCTRINPSTNKPCNTIFSRPYDLTRHEDTIHNNRKQKVRCPMCREEKTFSRNDALTRHMRVVHPEVETFGKRSRRSD